MEVKLKGKGQSMKRLSWLATVAGMMCACAAADATSPNLDGVWSLAQPQSLLTPADRAPIPFTDKGRALYEKHKAQVAKSDYSFDLTMMRCSSPGMPRAMLLPGPFRIFQRADMVLTTFQWNHLNRQINLRQGPPLRNNAPDAEFSLPTKMGTATGRWEGDTLVVHTTNLSDQKLLDGLLANSEQLELMERLKLRGPNVLEDRITITDPENYSRPWDVVLTYKRLADNTFPFPEDVCLDRKAAGQSPLPR